MNLDDPIQIATFSQSGQKGRPDVVYSKRLVDHKAELG